MFVLGLDWWVMHDVVHLVALLLLALVLVLLPYLLGLAMLLAACCPPSGPGNAARCMPPGTGPGNAARCTPPEAEPGSAARCSPWGAGDMLLATNNIFVLSRYPCNLHDSDMGGSEYEQYSSVVSTPSEGDIWGRG